MKPIIFPYKLGSASAKALAQRLDTKRVKPDGRYKVRRDHLVINWGNAGLPKWWKWEVKMVNRPQCVAIATNKLHALGQLLRDGVKVPQFTTDIEIARTLFEKTRRVYCRKMLRGHSGNGIVVANSPDDLVTAPLYTVGIDGHRDEYRVHVFNRAVIDVQQKKRRKDVDNDTVVRNHDNGWVYCRDGVEWLGDVNRLALEAVKSLHLDFGAVDIVRRRKSGECYVLEVNTAAGLEGATLEKYATAIEGIL